jgi:Cu(I)/Ag(I) efflux system periplasmic protein CusF
MKKHHAILAILSAGLACTFAARAQPMDHGQAGHAAKEQAETSGTAQGRGVIHAIDASGRSVNLTHEPIPALSWPGMTMDLPVTEQVDLSGLRPDDRVSFSIQLGSDNQYRITGLKRLD